MKLLSIITLLAHRNGMAMMKNGSAEGIGGVGVVDGMQRGRGRGGKGGTIRGGAGAKGGFVSNEAVAEGVGGGFVVAAGKDGTVGGDDAAGPETVTGTAAGTVEMV